MQPGPISQCLDFREVVFAGQAGGIACAGVMDVPSWMPMRDGEVRFAGGERRLEVLFLV